MVKLFSTTIKPHKLWENLPHPSYSPDIAPSDYHLFRSFQSFLDDTECMNYDGVKMAVEEYFASYFSGDL